MIYTIKEMAAMLPDDGTPFGREMRVRRALAGHSICQDCDIRMPGKQSFCPGCGEPITHNGGAFPGATKLNAGTTSTWTIPIAEAEAWLERTDHE